MSRPFRSLVERGSSATTQPIHDPRSERQHIEFTSVAHVPVETPVEICPACKSEVLTTVRGLRFCFDPYCRQQSDQNPAA